MQNVVVPPADINGLIIAPSTASIINDNDGQLSFSSNWQHISNRGDSEKISTYQGDTTITSSQDATMTYTFRGTGLRVYGEQGSSMGSYKIEIKDNGTIIHSTTVDQQHANRRGLAIQYDKTDFGYGEYTLTITTTTTNTVAIDALVVFNDTNIAAPSTMYNDNDSAITYTGSWEFDGGRPFGDYNGDAHYSNAGGAFAEFNFLGTGIKFYTEKNSDMGTYDIYIDDKKVGDATSYTSGSREAQVVTFEKNDLTYGHHKIKIVNTESNKWFVVDAFEVLNNQSITDRAGLQAKYDELIALKESDYTSESFVALKNALNNSKAVLDSSSSSVGQINEVYFELLIGHTGLVANPGMINVFNITSDGTLTRTNGLKATVDVQLVDSNNNHAGNEVVIFQLMKSTTPVSIIACEKKDIISKEKFTAYFNVQDPNNQEYSVKVFVFDTFSDNTNASDNLANELLLK